MNRSEVLFSDLTNEQLEQVKALETKFNTPHTKNQEIVLIAYANPKH